MGISGVLIFLVAASNSYDYRKFPRKRVMIWYSISLPDTRRLI